MILNQQDGFCQILRLFLILGTLLFSARSAISDGDTSTHHLSNRNTPTPSPLEGCFVEIWVVIRGKVVNAGLPAGHYGRGMPRMANRHELRMPRA